MRFEVSNGSAKTTDAICANSSRARSVVTRAKVMRAGGLDARKKTFRIHPRRFCDAHHSSARKTLRILQSRSSGASEIVANPKSPSETARAEVHVDHVDGPFEIGRILREHCGVKHGDIKAGRSYSNTRIITRFAPVSKIRIASHRSPEVLIHDAMHFFAITAESMGRRQ